MKTILIFCISLISFTGLYSQGTKTNIVSDIVQPQFHGNLYKYLSNNLKYPEKARKNNIEGTVYVSFIVEKDGSVSNIAVMRSVNIDLDVEAVRVVSHMPRWIPGMKDGKPARVQYTLPIRFKLA